MPAGWKILDQTQTLDIGTDGKGHDVVAVDYTNDAGTITGRIVVPLDADTAKTFATLFGDRIAMHEQIAGQ